MTEGDLIVVLTNERTTAVVAEQTKTVFTATELALAIQVTDQDSILVEPRATPEIVVAGGQGPAGPTGPAGSPGQSVPSLSYSAGEVINGHRAVHLVNGQVFHADKDDASTNAVLGISLNAASIGGDVEIRYVGVVTEPSWTWTPGGPIFLGDDGMIVQTPPGSGALVELGIALTPTSINVRIQEPIVLN